MASTAEKMKMMRYERTLNGLCDRCGKPAVDGLHRCNKCGIEHRVRERNRIGGNARTTAWRYQGE